MSARKESFRIALALVFFGLMVFVFPILAQQSIVLVAAGSELPEGLFLNWNAEYVRSVAGTSIDYLPLGTDEGKRQMQQGVADLGGGDAPLTSEQLQNSRGKVIQVPVAVVGIAVVCNVPGVKQELNLSGPVLADIFLSKITKWNDPEIAKLNPGVTLPPAGILVLHRSKGKGANYIFSDYLSRVSPEFKAKIGRGFSPNWDRDELGTRRRRLVPGEGYRWSDHVPGAEFGMEGRRGVGAPSKCEWRIREAHASVGSDRRGPGAGG